MLHERVEGELDIALKRGEPFAEVLARAVGAEAGAGEKMRGGGKRWMIVTHTLTMKSPPWLGDGAPAIVKPTIPASSRI
jgi:broad specificity phosphatase PhoE